MTAAHRPLSPQLVPVMRGGYISGSIALRSSQPATQTIAPAPVKKFYGSHDSAGAVLMPTRISEELDRLPREDNWDEEGAPAPSKEATAFAADVVRWALVEKLSITEVDADVLGGVAVWLQSLTMPDRRAWISGLNRGDRTIVLSEHKGTSRSLGYGKEALLEAARFLR